MHVNMVNDLQKDGEQVKDVVDDLAAQRRRERIM
jgi:hypothetical protein